MAERDKAVDQMMIRVAGEVVISEKPWETLKSWRSRFGIKQREIAESMGVSPSVLSDYESGRRISPGIGFVKRYVVALVHLAMQRGPEPSKTDNSAILALGEFSNPVGARDIVRLLKGEVVAGNEYLEGKIYGYTVLDSIKTIYALSGFDFYKIFGSTTERVLVFTKVGLGRSPMVAVRVSPLKPRMVVLHGPASIDTLAVNLAAKEKIILVLSNLGSERLIAKKLSIL